MSKLLALLLAASLSPALRAAANDTPPTLPPPLREIRLPYNHLHLLLQSAPESVMLPKADYDALKEAADKREKEAPPRHRLVAGADYAIALGEASAMLTAHCRLVSLIPEPGLLLLPIEGVGLHDVDLQGNRAPLWRDTGAHLAVRLDGEGDYSLRFSGDIPVNSSAARQTLSFRLPAAAATTLTLTAPGDVDIKSGAAVSERTYDPDADITTFRLLPTDGPMTLSLSLNSRQQGRERAVVARSVLVDEITEAYERLHATVSCDIMHQAVDTLRFALPAGFEVLTVHAPEVSTWRVTGPEAGHILEVQLRDALTGKVVLGILCTAPPPTPGEWSFPRFAPLDISTGATVLGVLLDTRLTADPFVASGMIGIGVDVLAAALPRSVFAAEAGAPAIRPVAAFFSPLTAMSLQTVIRRPDPALAAETTTRLTVSEAGLDARVTCRIAAARETCFAVDILAPPRWDVLTVTQDDGTSLPFDSHPRDNGRRLVQVRLPQGIPSGKSGQIHLQTQAVQHDWTTAWEQPRQLQVPLFQVVGATRNSGFLLLQAIDDLAIQGCDAQGAVALDHGEAARLGLSAMEGALLFRYDAPQTDITLSVGKQHPRITAESFAFFRFDSQETMHCRYELLYDIHRAGVQQLQFDLPLHTPTALDVRGIQGCQVKEFSAADQEHARRWTVRLDSATRGIAHLGIQLQMRLPKETGKNLALPLARAVNVAYQSGRIAVEGSADVDCRILTHPRTVDVGELVDAAYRPGPRLLGVFGFSAEKPDISVSLSRHAPHALPDTIVRRAELAMGCGRNGRIQTAARFLLVTKADALTLTLPPGATLWSVLLDGVPLAPQTRDGALLLGLPPHPQALPRDLQVIYESSGPGFAFRGTIQAAAPQLILRRHSGEPVAIPTADLAWVVHLPQGYVIDGFKGTVTTTLRPRTPAILHLGRLLLRLGGGISQRRGLLARLLGQLGHAKTRAIQASGTVKGVALDGYTMLGDMGENVADTVYADMDGLRADEPRAEPAAETAAEKQALKRLKTDMPAQKPAPIAKTEAAAFPWALEGARSLDISLTGSGNTQTFTSLGHNPWLALQVSDSRRLRTLAGLVFLVVLLAGARFGGADPAPRRAFLLVTLALAGLVSLFCRNTAAVLVSNGAFFAACVLIPYYLASACVRRVTAWRSSRSLRRTAAAAALLGVFLLSIGAAAQPLPTPAAEETTTLPTAPAPGATAAAGAPMPDRSMEATPDQAPQTSPNAGVGQPPWSVELVEPHPISMPEDAIVIPYDLPDGGSQSSRVLLPYTRFRELWNKAHPQDQTAAILRQVPYALGAAQYKTRLSDADNLFFQGQVHIEVFVDEVVAVPLSLSGAVLARATVNGKPARLQQRPAPSPENETQQAILPDAGRASLLTLYLNGPGSHAVDLELYAAVGKRGGWRHVAASLPATPATRLSLTVPRPDTDLTCTALKQPRTLRTQAAEQTVDLGLGPQGAVTLDWRPRLSEAAVDRTLTVESEAIFDIQEDVLRLTWKPTFFYRDGERERFTVTIPGDYRVENVTGANVKAWESSATATARELTITLLKATAHSETCDITLWSSGIGPAATQAPLPFPAIGVPAAARHTARVIVRHSPLLQLHSEAGSTVQRTDLPGDLPLAPHHSESPVGLRLYEAYTALNMPPEIRFTATATALEAGAQVRSILRLGRRERILESRIDITAKRPLFEVSLNVPDNLEVDHLQTPGQSEWSISGIGAERRLAVRFAQGLGGTVTLVLQGRIQLPLEHDQPLSLPMLTVVDAGRQEGDLVVMADPGYRLNEQQLDNLKRISTQQHAAWIPREQVRLVQAAFHWQGNAYSGQIVLSLLPTQAEFRAITNVRITERSLEETVLLIYRLRQGGLREVTLTVPPRLADADFKVPQLRRKTVTPRADGNGADVRLEFQDRLTGDFTVLIEQDRPLESDVLHITPVTATSGTATQQLIVIESAGRDEVVLHRTEGLDPISMQSAEWHTLSNLLNSDPTYSFSVQSGHAEPSLSLQTRQRAPVATAGARIGLAHALLMLDAAGAFRGQQTYFVDNRTEQFLVINLPPNAALWTAQVAGEFVKPVHPAAAAPDQVHIPIVKTAEGDLDYQVVLKYGGRLRLPQYPGRIAFPLLRTVNISAEQSQVELRLPPQYQWLRFGGSMRPVAQADDLQAGYLSYQTRVAERLVQALQAGNEFAKARASSNLGVLNEAIRTSQSRVAGSADAAVQMQVGQANIVLDDVQRRLRERDAGERAEQPDNRYRMNEMFQQQDARLPRDEALTKDWWSRQEPEAEDARPKTTQFNRDWLTSNQLARPGEQVSPMGGPVPPTAAPKDSLGESAPTRAPQGRVLQMGQIGILETHAELKKDVNRLETEPPTKAKGRLQEELEKPRKQQRLERYQAELQQQGAGPTPDSQRELGRRVRRPREIFDLPASGLDAAAHAAPAAPVTLDLSGQPGWTNTHEAPGGLASLDVDLPHSAPGRWQIRQFTTPRGTVDIHVYALPNTLTRTLVAVGLVLLLLVVLYGMRRWFRASGDPLTRRGAMAVLLVCGGVFALVFGILPVYAVLSVLCGIALALIARRQKRRPLELGEIG